MTPDNEDVLIEKIIQRRFVLDRYTAVQAFASAGILQSVAVRAVPVTQNYSSDPGKQVDAALTTFVNALNSKAPQDVRRKSGDLVYNVNQLHQAIQTKWDLVYTDPAVPVKLSVDFEAPLGLLHRVHPTEPWRWIRIDGGSAYFGSNIYRTALPDGTYQAIAIEYVTIV